MPVTNGQLWCYILLGALIGGCGGLWLGIACGNLARGDRPYTAAQTVLAVCALVGLVFAGIVFMTYATMMGWWAAR